MRASNTLRAGLMTATFFACAGTAMAQDDFTSEGVADTAAKRLAAAPLDSPASSVSGIQISSDKDDSNVSIRVGDRWNATVLGGENVVEELAWSVTASSPLDKSSGRTNLASLDGLAGSTSLKAEWRLMRVGFGSVPSDAQLRPLCNQARAANKLAPLAADAVCDDTAFSGQPKLYEKYRLLALGERPLATVYSFNAKAGTESFEYVDTATLKPRSVEETPWSVGFDVTWYRLIDRDSFTVSIDRQAAWKAPDEVILCPGGGGPVTCVKGPPGPPVRKDTSLLGVEYRRFDALTLGESTSIRFGLALSATYDTEADVYGVEAPLYLVPNGDGMLSGGVRLGWRSDTDEVTLGVFVGAPLSLF